METKSIKVGKTTVSIHHGDIRKLTADVIVSSADTHLSGMLEKAILEKGGPELQTEIDLILAKQSLKLGDVIITGAGALNAKKVFHAITFDEEKHQVVTPFGVALTTYTCLKHADSLGLESIVFPAMGTGPGQNDMESVSKAMIQKIFDFLGSASTGLKEIKMCLYNPGAWSKFFEDFTLQAAKREIESALPVRLAILRQGEINYIDITTNETISIIETVKVGKKQIKGFATALEAFIKTGESKKYADLEELGIDLYEELLGPVDDRLKRLPSENLFLKLDDDLLSIPWELCHDGTDFIGLKYNIGRQVVVSPNFYTQTSGSKPLSYPLKVLLLADPTESLPGAIKECNKIRDSLSKIEGIELTYKKGKEIELTSLLEDLENYDLVHYAGHAFFDKENPSESGWKIDLETDEVLTASMMAAMNAPSIVFANACESGTQSLGKEKKYQGQIFGIASGFLMGGIKNYIGTFTYVNDVSSVDFAVEFYKNLVQKRETVGSSLRQARKFIIKKYGKEDILWASYMLYGDPQFKLNI
ncbi:MAG TPA: CHAT domain-containing protein [Candidatus Deferrimicrobium sp.]|nr:CHAT domain-containing protein [Candidatus Deferrimicrobium sp.]